MKQEQRRAQIIQAIETLKNGGMPVNVKEVQGLTDCPRSVLYTFTDLHEAMGIKKYESRRRKNRKQPVGTEALASNRYTSMVKDIFIDEQPMSRQDVADELRALTGNVDGKSMVQALNSLVATSQLTLDSKGYYRAKAIPVQAEAHHAVLMDESGNVTHIKHGETALQVAERLIRQGAKKIMHLVAAEVFETTTTITTHKINL